jgi:hypothetical protein
MIGFLVWLACATSPAGGGLKQAIELLGAGDARGALVAAESEPDARARAQARVHVLHAAGDLEAALAAAHVASDSFADDAWLAQKWNDIAATLHRADEARSAAARLENAVKALPEPERAMWADAVRAARSYADDLLVARARRRTAERLARCVSLGAVSAAVAALLALGLIPLRRQRMSSTPVDPTESNNVAGGSQ